MATCSTSPASRRGARSTRSAVRYRPDHWLLVEGGRIAGVQAEAPGEGWERHDHAGRLVLPGFIDTHVHSPQIDVIASYGTELLDWLTTHTFPAEARHADLGHAEAAAALFLDALLAHGTTSAVVFPTVHKHSVDALFAGAEARGMRLIAGKVLMDRNAPDDLRDDAASAERDMTALIARWHGRARLAYAVTVRFAPTSSPEQLALAGRFCARRPEPLHADARGREPRRGEVGARAVSRRRAATSTSTPRPACCTRGACSRTASGSTTPTAPRSPAAGAQIAHSPSSNLFLGSGLFGWRAAEAAGVHVSLASDVGGGTSLSMLRNMADAYKIQALAGERLTAWKALHAATRGAAHALGLGGEIGSLEPGRDGRRLRLGLGARAGGSAPRRDRVGPRRSGPQLA